MRVHLESNFFLLGSQDLESIDFERSDVTLRELLDIVSHRSCEAPEFFLQGRAELSPGWIVEVNGNPLGLYNVGLETILKDGDKVAIKLELICGG